MLKIASVYWLLARPRTHYLAEKEQRKTIVQNERWVFVTPPPSPAKPRKGIPFHKLNCILEFKESHKLDIVTSQIPRRQFASDYFWEIELCASESLSSHSKPKSIQLFVFIPSMIDGIGFLIPLHADMCCAMARPFHRTRRRQKVIEDKHFWKDPERNRKTTDQMKTGSSTHSGFKPSVYILQRNVLRRVPVPVLCSACAGFISCCQVTSTKVNVRRILLFERT